MLELIISILLALGMKTDPVNGKVKVSQEVLVQIQTQPAFNELGGASALNDVITTDDVDPNR